MLCEEGTNYAEITDEMVTETNGSEFRFVRVRKQIYQRKGATLCMIQIADISKSIMIDQITTEKQLYEVINTTVSHEMRNPINSIEFQGQNVQFLLEKVSLFLNALDETP